MIETNTKPNPSDMNRETFLRLIEQESVSFTEPQQRFVERIKDGWFYTIKNPHRLSGGEYVWVTEDGYEEEGGRIYSLLGNVSRAFKKQTGQESEISSWLRV